MAMPIKKIDPKSVPLNELVLVIVCLDVVEFKELFVPKHLYYILDKLIGVF